MKNQLRGRFYVETVLGALSCISFVVTLINHTWIEALFNVDPDSGSGGVEWAIIAGFVLATLVSLSLAGYEVRRFRAALTA